MVEQQNITEDEVALYDRQIRLWGLDAQRRLRAAKVLLIGLGGLGAEVAKNTVLAGINSLTLLDHTQVTEEDWCSQFLVSRKDIGKNRAACSLEHTQKLNSMVTVVADTMNVNEKSDDFFTAFNVVCATCCPISVLLRINKICHKSKIQFFAGDVFGYYGYMFADLGVHEYAEEMLKPKQQDLEPADDGEPLAKKPKKEEMETIVTKKICEFNCLQDALDFDWSSSEGKQQLKKTPLMYFTIQVIFRFLEKHKRRPSSKSVDFDMKELVALKTNVLESFKVDPNIIDDTFSSNCFAELGPVSAIVGGVLGQEIIKAVSQKDKPHNNFFFFDGLEGSGLIDKIGS